MNRRSIDLDMLEAQNSSALKSQLGDIESLWFGIFE